MASTRTPGAPARQPSAMAGLDSVELGPLSASRSPRRLVRKGWTATWPKLLAIGLVLGAWQLFYLSNFNGDTAAGLIKGPGAGLANLWDQLQHAQLWQAIGTTAQTAVTGYLLALVIGSVVGPAGSRVPPLAAPTRPTFRRLLQLESVAY